MRTHPLARCVAIGGLVGLLAALAGPSHTPLLLSSFGASTFLVVSDPHHPFAQPKALVGGHLLSTVMGLACLHTLGTGFASLGLAVALAVGLMMLTKTVHPPAAGNPILVFTLGPSWSFLWAPAGVGVVLLLGLLWAYHRWVSGQPYPTSSPASAPSAKP
jgi:CBS-domain-containing membrane protein